MTSKALVRCSPELRAKCLVIAITATITLLYDTIVCFQNTTKDTPGRNWMTFVGWGHGELLSHYHTRTNWKDSYILRPTSKPIHHPSFRGNIEKHSFSTIAVWTPSATWDYTSLRFKIYICISINNTMWNTCSSQLGIFRDQCMQCDDFFRNHRSINSQLQAQGKIIM